MYVYSHWSLEADEPEKEATNFSFNSILLIVWKVRKIPGKEKKRKEKKKESASERRKNIVKKLLIRIRIWICVSFLTVTGELQLLLTVHLLLYNYYYSIATTNQYWYSISDGVIAQIGRRYVRSYHTTRNSYTMISNFYFFSNST